MSTLSTALALALVASPASSTRMKPPPSLPKVLAPVERSIERARDPKAIREVPLEPLFATELGAASKSEVLYADLTGDGKEEAVVPLYSGGSAGDVAVAIYGYDAHGALSLLYYRTGQHLLVALKSGQLELTEPIYGPNDPNCCPSGKKVSVVRWDGKAFKESPAGP